ncbi:MAG: DUF4347 domain-containing protein [Gammaproteobacteria bacterium]|nr:DUF4347 domain-containing protein [Gammaproteobacteria bacterium]
MGKKIALTGLIHEELEPRLLFSAGAEAVLLDTNLPDDEAAIVETISEAEVEILQLETIQHDAYNASPASEVIFIDENVPDYDELMADLAGKDHIDIYILDTSLDGVHQISAVLENYQDLDAIHLVSHGDEEGLYLGNSSLTNDTLDSYRDTITGWQSALSEQADLLIYGCDVASSEEGLNLLESLNVLTGTDIAASDDITGHADLGGDWDLEFQSGIVETNLAFSEALQQDWVGILPPNNAPVNSVPGTQTTVTDIPITFSSGNGNLISVSDADSDIPDVTISVTNGTITLSQTTGLSITAGADGSSSITVNGAYADINAALDGMVYTPTSSWTGTDTLTIYTYDNGFGGGGPLSDTDIVTINVNANSVPTGGVAISGTVTEDQTLTADTTSLADADGLGTFSYQWLRDGATISGATGNTYTLTDTDVGTAISVQVSYTDGFGTSESVTSPATAAVANVNDAPAGGVAISGTVTEDQTLTADTSSLTDADGLGTFSYQWLRDGATITGATGSTYTLTDADVGTGISVEVSYTDGHGTSETVTSPATGAVANVNDAPAGGVAISGTVTEDQTLTAGTSSLTDADGLGTFSYQWLRDGATITGATGSTYTLTDADVGTGISVEVSYTDGHGTSETVTSPATGAVANVNDAPAGGVAISGTVTEDQTLTADTSSLTDADGLGTFSYQWLRDGATITGATGSTYTLTDADVGTGISVEVSYTDGHGTSETVTSPATGAVANVNDNPTGGVSITGTTFEGNNLTADTSSVSDADGLGTFSYQWLRDGATITGATGSSYTLTGSDVGANMTVEITYTDGHGTVENVVSSSIGPVTTNSAPTGGIAISGTVTEDQTLSADTSSLADADGLGTFSYQWLRDGATISGATGNTYTLTDADVGTGISVEVSYTDGNGTSETVTSPATGAVANVNDVPAGGVAISGTVTEDQTLTADTSSLTDADGLGTFSYQWLRDGATITGATGSTYTLNDADVGTGISVEVSYTDGHGTSETVTSPATAAVANINDTPTGDITISGTTTENQTLTADTASLADADGLGTFSFQWLRDGAPITGATDSSYTLTDADVGSAINVTISYTDTHGTLETLSSPTTSIITGVEDNSNTNETVRYSPPQSDIDTSGTEDDDSSVSIDITQEENPSEEADPDTQDIGTLEKEPDVKVTVDRNGTPTVLVTHSNQPLVQALIGNESGNEVNVISEHELVETENVLIDSISAWQADNIKLTDLQQVLDELNEQLGDDARAEESNGQIVIATTAGVTIGLTAGFVTWALQGSSLLTALLTTLPAWNSFDPLPILNAKKDKNTTDPDKATESDGVDSVFDDFNNDHKN